MDEILWTKRLLIIFIGMMGLFGLGLITHIIWYARDAGGENWEIPVSFNKSGEGQFELFMITLFLILFSIFIIYLFIITEGRKYEKYRK